MASVGRTVTPFWNSSAIPVTLSTCLSSSALSARVATHDSAEHNCGDDMRSGGLETFAGTAQRGPGGENVIDEDHFASTHKRCTSSLHANFPGIHLPVGGAKPDLADSTSTSAQGREQPRTVRILVRHSRGTTGTQSAADYELNMVVTAFAAASTSRGCADQDRRSPSRRTLARGGERCRKTITQRTSESGTSLVLASNEQRPQRPLVTSGCENRHCRSAIGRSYDRIALSTLARAHLSQADVAAIAVCRPAVHALGRPDESEQIKREGTQAG